MLLGKLYRSSCRSIPGWNKLLHYHKHLKHLHIESNDTVEEDDEGNTTSSQSSDHVVSEIEIDQSLLHKDFAEHLLEAGKLSDAQWIPYADCVLVMIHIALITDLKLHYLCTGYNRRLNQRVGTPHPNLWKFLLLLRQEKFVTSHLLVKLNSPHSQHDDDYDNQNPSLYSIERKKSLAEVLRLLSYLVAGNSKAKKNRKSRQQRQLSKANNKQLQQQLDNNADENNNATSATTANTRHTLTQSKLQAKTTARSKSQTPQTTNQPKPRTKSATAAK
ncbi:unnamed protein product [Didymodactylos carnosus]|uniref:Uncharacterized protein n=1 Tax=Didymodactylos carnosus TaxID=1234261 RepID=A0A814RGV2_9BILA|nr:unnamed protein product [Didymodactylos carnosus]CAF1133720.1 unnamed protein product [Didymodactylos carnosus]CAF3819737.1 unnamed protein product [Didymodactylos carnosus]CAF3897559.1 unnamed protein product [Didymodactylos carnosus]